MFNSENYQNLETELILKNISEYINLTEDEIETFISFLEYQTISKNDYLLRYSEICHYDYFIVSGCVKVCFIDEKGNENIIKFAPENWWVVDLDSYLNKKPALFYFQALERTSFFKISLSNYHKLNKEIPGFAQFLSLRWQQGFISLQQRIMQNHSLNAEQRYKQFQSKYPGLELRIPQKLIASYLGITPEHLSKLRNQRINSFLNID